MDHGSTFAFDVVNLSTFHPFCWFDSGSQPHHSIGVANFANPPVSTGTGGRKGECSRLVNLKLGSPVGEAIQLVGRRRAVSGGGCAAKGIEEQAPQALRGLRLRDVPIITFFNEPRPLRPRPVRPPRRDRAVAGARRDLGLLADRHGARLSRHL